MIARAARRRDAWSSALTSLVLVSALCATATGGSAQAAPLVVSTPAPSVVPIPTLDWTAPLDRRIVVHLWDVSLREALDRLSLAGRVRLSYSAELIPLSRTVRASFDSVALGDALVAVLRDVAVTETVAGPDQVVLVPVRDAAARRVVAADAEPRALERVVVTGSSAGSSERPVTVALNVVSGRELVRSGVSDLAGALSSSAAGLWVWQQSPASILSRFGSVRGASSFGLSYPKIYVDGIAVANPLLLTRLNPEGVERVEVIRGPQGAALYGADAISGVVNIVTRADGAADGTPRATLLSTAGFSQSDYAPQALLAQDHTLSLAAGSVARSARVDLGVGTLGAYYPGASSNDIRATAGLRLLGARSVVTATARFFSKHVGVASNPLLVDSAFQAAASQANASGQSLNEYTVGATARIVGGEHWTHTFTAGLDGYSLSNAANDFTPFPAAADSALRAASGSANRSTLRVSSTGHFGSREGVTTALTFAAEHSALREETPVVSLMESDHRGRQGGPSAPAPQTSSIDLLTDAGLVAQADLALHDNWFLTLGTRLERSDAYVGSARVSALPMVGAAMVRDMGDLTIKVRAAFGKGIRAPRTAARGTVLGTVAGRATTRASALALGPEEQTGVEAGIDLFVGRTLTFRVTGFDQLASGLIQQVVIPDSSSNGPGAAFTRLALEYQNVGAISNRGWELEATSRHSALSLGAAISIVESRVQRLATAYTGDLRTGDRVLGVPSATISLSAGWIAARWQVTVQALRATDWIDYDRLALASAYVHFDRRSVPLVGEDLRGYWRPYDGSTRLRATLSRDIGRGFSFVLAGENLLGAQLGEPDNVTIVPGRTITTGIRSSWF